MIDISIIIATAGLWLLFIYCQSERIVTRFLMPAGMVTLAGWLCIRTTVIGHPPLTTVYETLLLFALLYSLKTYFSGMTLHIKRWLMLPAVIALFSAIFLSLFTGQNKSNTSSFESLWLYLHVPVLFIGYISLVFAFIMQWLRLRGSEIQEKTVSNEILISSIAIAIGIVTGALWAHKAWGRYWAWDGKETFALITWLAIAAAYYVRKPKARFALLCISMLLMLSTYFVASFFLGGQHSYKMIH